MDFDGFRQLLPIIFLIIWFIIRANSRKKAEKPEIENPPEQPSRPTPKQRESQTAPGQIFQGPLFSSVKENLDDLFDEIGEAVKKDLPGTQLEQPKIKQSGKSDGFLTEKKATAQVKRKSLIKEDKRPRLVAKSVADTLKSRVAPSEPQTKVPEKRSRRKNIDLSPSKLKEAIILSEIIAPPIALRDE